MSNEAFEKELPQPPAGLAWQVGVSGDGGECSVTFRLFDPRDEKRYILASTYDVPGSTTAENMLRVIAGEARSLLNRYERALVLHTLPGVYHLPKDELEELFQAPAAEKEAA